MKIKQIKLTEAEDQIELIQTMASNKREEAREAQEVFAEFVGPIIQDVLTHSATLANTFEDLPFDQYSSPTIPLDQFYDIKETEYARVWSQTLPGGLPTNMTHGIGEMTFTTYPLYGSQAFLKKYAAQSRLDVIANSLNLLASEILLKQELISASVILAALAQEVTENDGREYSHVIRAEEAGNFKLQDLNRLFTLIKRIRNWGVGTAPTSGRGLTDLIVSHEIVESVRGFSFNPLNTKGTKSDIPGTDELRNSIYNSAGTLNFLGVNFIEIGGLGKDCRFNKLFDAYAGTKTFGGSTFDENNEEILIGIDSSLGALKRPVETQPGTGSGPDGNQFVVVPDDQYVARSEKIGFYGSLREGRIIVDARALVGLIV